MTGMRIIHSVNIELKPGVPILDEDLRLPRGTGLDPFVPARLLRI